MSVIDTKLGELGKKLADLHRSFPAGDKTVAIHVFGLKHGAELLPLTRDQLDKVSVAAGLKPIYGLELRKMAKLSCHVELK